MNLRRLGAVCSVIAFAAILWFGAGSVLAARSSIDVNVKSQHKSGVSAKATLTSQDGATVVTLSVFGGKGTQFLPDLRTGTCAHPAQTPEIPLAMTSSVEATKTTIDIPLADFSDGSYVIMLHKLDGNLASLGPKTALACGAIGSKPVEGTVSAAPVTGIGPVGARSGDQWPVLAFAAAAGGTGLAGWSLRKWSVGR
jgi:hypothetical protein